LYTNLALIKDLLHFIKAYKGRFIVGTLLRVTSDIVWLYPVWAISEVINFATSYQPGASLHYFWFLMISTVLAALYHFPSRELAKYFIYNIAEKIAVEARLKTIEHMFRLDTRWHEKENTGNKIRRMDKGSDSLNDILRLYVDLIIESTINLIAITFIFSQLKLGLALILIFFFVTYFFLSIRLTKRASHQSHVTNVEWEQMEGVSFEAINNINTIKSLHLGVNILAYLKQKAKKLVEEIRKRVIYFRTRQTILDIYQELFRQGMIFYTVWNVFEGNFEVGVIALVLLYFNKIRESAGEFAEVANEWVIGKIAIMRMKDILNEQPDIEVKGTKTLPPIWKKLDIQGVHFSYGGRKVLNDFSLTIKRGQRIGIVGLSGEGKSTLFKLLLKLHADYEGFIKFDDLEFRTLKSSSFFKQVAVVPQETELFNLSLKENITLSPQLSGKQKKQLEKSIEIAHVKDFMHKLPEGVESLVGEKGVKLSGGEKQRVGLARAIYRQPTLLLLDEATSHLDIESEKKIQNALHKFFQETTAIVIAHRLSTLKEMDRIVVIKKGQVAEDGSFEDLMKKKGEFYRLWEKQKF